ncbi:chromatin protein Cren7 [Candidatus Bathyarchaeota archaeon]|nr:MAG: chromatin protein Cren7 [Candidatus Bathyarchaeota archaeon]
MPKKRTQQHNCPECGTPAKEPYKTWELVAPFPDKKMRITVTIFGMYECPKCSKIFRGVVSKAKLGSEGIDL